MRRFASATALVLAASTFGSAPARARADSDEPAMTPATASPPPRGAAPAAAATPDPSEPARIYVYVGHTYWPGGSRTGILGRRWDVSVDGGRKVPVGTDTFVEFDAPPGKHIFTRYGHFTLPIAPASIEVTVEPGEEVYLGLNQYQAFSPTALKLMNAGAALSGGLGGALIGGVGGVAVGAAGGGASSLGVIAASPKATDKHPLGVWLTREPPPKQGQAAGTP